jgi:hypothetical protein
MPATNADVLTAREAVQHLGVRGMGLHGFLVADQLPRPNVGHSWRFRRSDSITSLQARR